MQRLNYPLNKYIKAAEKIALANGFSRIEIVQKRGSVVRFDVFQPNESKPCNMWTVHTEHNKKRNIISKDDYRKMSVYLKSSMEQVIETLESL